MEYLAYICGFFAGKELSIPLSEVISYVVIITFCLLFGRHSLGLIISYGFVFYWGYVFNLYYFIDLFYGTTWGFSIYIILGFLMFIIAIVSFFIGNRD